MNYETLRELTHQQLHERMSDAQRERLALQMRRPRYRRSRRRVHAGMLGQLLATRQHATR